MSEQRSRGNGVDKKLLNGMAAKTYAGKRLEKLKTSSKRPILPSKMPEELWQGIRRPKS